MIRTAAVEDWPKVPFRYLASVRKGRLPPSRNDPVSGANYVPYLTMEYLRGESSNPTLVSADPTLLMASPGSIVLLWDGSNAGEFLRAKQGAVSSTSALVTPQGVDPAYFYWACKAHESRIRATTVGMGIPHVNGECLANIRIKMPPPSRQRAIANYLDRETARLDTLMTEKKRMLALLAEKREAIIARAVIRGVDPNVPLRHSGVQWIGKIPQHWKIQRIAWLFRERDLRGQPHLPLLRVSISSGVALRKFSTARIESTAADFNTYKVARRGDLVFNKMRMWQGAVGIAPEDGLVSPDYVVAEPTESLSSRYVSFLLRTPAFSAECARRSHGIVWDRLRLYWGSFRNIEVPVPSLQEQDIVAEWMTSKSTVLDDLGCAIRRATALLEERRVSVISAAVTGQLDIGEAS